MSTDGGKIVLAGPGIAAPHTCAQPGMWSGLERSNHPQWRLLANDARNRALVGSIWRCDCGQHWGLGSDLVWRPMTERKAQRAIRRAARTISTTTTTEHT